MLKSNSSNKLYFAWACDLRDHTGEGSLGISFLKFFSKQKDISIVCFTPYGKFIFKNEKILKSPKIVKKKNPNPNFLNNYIMPLIGIIFLNFFSFKGYNIIYVNFLPLWNFLIFSLLPKKTILGPVTGFNYNGRINSFGTFFRYYVLKYFFYVSIFFINRRFKKIAFSTNLLKKTVKNKIKIKKKFNFILLSLKYISRLNRKKKKIYLIYNRNYIAKQNYKRNKLIETLSKKGVCIKIVGHFLKIKDVKNLGIVRKKKLEEIIATAKITILSNENLFSLFSLECLKNNLTVFYDKVLKHQKSINFKNLRKLDYKNYEVSTIKVMNFLNKKNDYNNHNNLLFKKRISSIFYEFEKFYSL